MSVIFRSVLTKRIISSRISFSTTNSASFCQKNVENKPDPDDNPTTMTRIKYYPSDFDKKILVWTKKYKKVEDVPKYIKAETMDRAKNHARIKTCNYMILLTIIGCVIMAISGRRAAERGESVTQSNLAWHKAMSGDEQK